MTSTNGDQAFDIFKMLPDGEAVWITARENFEEAKHKMAQLAEISPAKYIVYFQGRGIIAEYSPGSLDWVEVT
jgi:hypothetical protein